MNLSPEPQKSTDLSRLRKIAYGADSEVFLTASREVLKRYIIWRSDPAQVALYHSVTNAAADHLQIIPESTELRIGNSSFTCSFEVNPILEYWLDQNKVPIVKSAFVPGPRFNQVQDGNEKFSRELDGLPPNERAFFEKSYWTINELELMSERMNYCQFSDSFFLDKLTIKLNHVLAVTGISLVPLNMKLRVNPDLKQASMIITDLCPGLARLSKR